MHTLTSFRRYLLSVTIAVLITGGLLLIMYQAIHNDEPNYIEADPLRVVQMLPVIPDEPLPPPHQHEEPPPPPEVPPHVPQLKPEIIGTDGGAGQFPAPESKPDLDIKGSGAEGDFLPIMTVPPEYPPRMLGRGIEGWVLVEFTVDEIGRVQSPRVVGSHPGAGFNNAALRAVLRYKYKPRIVNGDAVPVSGVRQRIVFNVST